MKLNGLPVLPNNVVTRRLDKTIFLIRLMPHSDMTANSSEEAMATPLGFLNPASVPMPSEVMFVAAPPLVIDPAKVVTWFVDIFSRRTR